MRQPRAFGGPAPLVYMKNIQLENSKKELQNETQYEALSFFVIDLDIFKILYKCSVFRVI